MRNPERIEDFLQEFGTLWKDHYPDWRYGQLLMNFLSVYGDVFYLEEDQFLVAFKAFLNHKDPREAVVTFLQDKQKASERKENKHEE